MAPVMKRMLVPFALVAVLLSGCTAASQTATPLTTSQRLADYAETVQSNWGPEVLAFPNPTTETFGFNAIDTPTAWQRAVNACFEANQVTNATAGDSFSISYSSDSDGLYLQSAFFACVIRFPTPQQLNSLLSDSQLSALYDYYLTFVEPCMLRSGVLPAKAPTRRAFIAGYHNQVLWHPFDVLTRSTDDARAQSSTADTVDLTRVNLTKMCPPEPKWMLSADFGAELDVQ